MAYEKLILLAPCHGLEDFPLYHTGEDAASLLACWTSLWHPLFLDSAKHLPHIERCDYPTDEIDNGLLLLPKPCENELDADLPTAAESKNATLIRDLHTRREILQRALECYGDAADKLDKELVRDFLAFGFAFLQVEVLTQQMRYSSSIDQTRIAREIKTAAAAAIAGDADTCREKLTVCHDALADERSHYYPVEVYLVDLTLLATAESTLGKALDRQLESHIPQNFIATGETIERLAEVNPSAVKLIRHRLADGTIGLAGGEYEELPLPLMSMDCASDQLAKGRAVYREHLGHAPGCFARRKNGIYPNLANVLQYAGFDSALHLKFDEGQMPESGLGRTKWKVGDEKLLDCYARTPLDASSHETFLNLPSSLSETMDTDHVATRMFVHWPGHVAPWYDDLRRCGRYGTALGRFVTLQEYFREADNYSATDSFQPDDYVYPNLKHATAADHPVSQNAEFWQQSVAETGRQGMHVIASCLGDAKNDSPEAIKTGLQLDESNARTIINPFSFARRILIVGDEFYSGTSIYAAGKQSDGTIATLVDVPAMGFASVHSGGHGNTQASADNTKDFPDLAEELTLGNEFFQATIDPVTGSLRSLRDYKSRKTRLSQQLAFRITLPKTGQPWVDSKAPVAYSVMAADSVEHTANGKIFAEITAKGRMLALNGELVGEFVQRYGITRGNRVLDVDIELTTVPEVMLEDPWDSYYACRFAFGDESAILRAGSRLQVHDVSRRRFEAPLFADIDCGEQHTTILTGGLPYHRRVTDKQLDTLIAVQGETANRFRIGIGVDLPSMTRSAIDFIAASQNDVVLPGRASSDSGWFMHVDARNCVIPWWQPLEDGDGVRLRIVETDGRKSRANIRSWKPWREAHVIDASGEIVEELTITEGVAEVPVEPGAFRELRLKW